MFSKWQEHAEDPYSQVEAAMRADLTSQRHVMQAAHDYQSARARGDKSALKAAESRLRQMWESDVRRRGWKPEDFIPNYPHYTPLPVPIYSAFGQWNVSSIVPALGISLVLYSLVFPFVDSLIYGY